MARPLKPMVILETSHGAFALKAADPSADTVGCVLRAHGVPLSAVWVHARSSDGESAVFVSTSERLASATRKHGQVIARLSRNIALPALLTGDEPGLREVEGAATEWVFPDRQRGAFKRILSQMTTAECFEFVCRNVDEVLSSWPARGRPALVVGTSGGGDSNVMLSALMKSTHISVESVCPVMMLGIPDWDKQLPQARRLCRRLGIELRVIEGDEVARFAGVRSLPKLRSAFTGAFPDADLEFLGTWLLRRVLSAYADETGVRHVAVGANREDLLGEGLARVATGKLPLPAPFRTIGRITFVYPMWKVPKKIGDGAFPGFSLANYQNRDPSNTRGRSLYYYLAYILADAAPGIDLDMVRGFSQLATLESEPFELDSELDDHVVAGTDRWSLVERWKRVLKTACE